MDKSNNTPEYQSNSSDRTEIKSNTKEIERKEKKRKEKERKGRRRRSRRRNKKKNWCVFCIGE